MSDIEIRPTIPADLDALADILLQVHATDGYPVEGVDDARAWVDLPKALGQWTALLEGQPVGHVALKRPDLGDGAPRLLTEQQGVPPSRIATLARLFVSPTARGRSAARCLLDAALDRARRDDLAVVLDVMSKDRNAIQLYRSSGWRFLGELDHVITQGSRVKALAFCWPG
ncbi:N-acetyltransferase family protein [Janibacter sp. Y6]|uniref:N-acetyltransferase family protein n=1 Tax=Janibacter sp. Y6 TaxID=2913552 RepID=UPI0034A38194